MSDMLQPGSSAPDFTLMDGEGTKHTLSNYRGKNVVLAFYPADWSSVCTSQLALYQAMIDEIRSYDAEVLAISVDNRWSHKAWAKHQQITFPLLSDFWPHGKIAQRYGVLRERDGITDRAVFVIDKEGVIRTSWVGEHPGIAPGLDIVFNALKDVQGETVTSGDSEQYTALTAEDWSLGPEDAPLTLLEYADFECPYCRRAHDVITDLRAELGDQLRVVYRHFPLPSHPHSLIASEAAEAAGAQGKFWEMHDLLYANQKQLAVEDVLGYAEQLRLDVDQFRKDLEQHTYAEAVKQDMLRAIDDGVNGTPTLFINGERYDGRRTRDALLEVLKA